MLVLLRITLRMQVTLALLRMQVTLIWLPGAGDSKKPQM